MPDQLIGVRSRSGEWAAKGAVALLLVAAPWLHAAASGAERTLRPDSRVGAIEVVVTNPDTDGFIARMQTYDPSITCAVLKDYAVNRVRGMLGTSGANLLCGAGQGGKLSMTLTFSPGPWQNVKGGKKTSDGVLIAGVSTIAWPDGTCSTVQSECGWVKRTDSELETAKKSIDLHVGLLLAGLAAESAKPDALVLALPQILPVTRCGEVCGKYQDGNIFDVLENLSRKRGPKVALLVVKSARPEVRWAAIAALGKTGDATAKKAVIAALDDGFWGVREAAALALLDLRARDSLTVLKEAIAKEKDQQTRASMTRVVQQLTMAPVKIVVGPAAIEDADAFYDPATKIVWCKGEVVLKRLGVEAPLPATAEKMLLFGDRHVSLRGLCARLPQLAGSQIALDHIADLHRVYLKPAAQTASG